MPGVPAVVDRILRGARPAEIPEKFGVSNVYGDVGQLFAQSVVAEPRLGAILKAVLERM